MRIYDPSKTQQTLFTLEFKSFSAEIEQKSYAKKYRTPGHTNKHSVFTSDCTVTCYWQTCTNVHNEDTHAYHSRLYRTGNTLYKETCLFGDFRNCGQPSTTGLSAYSYPLTQFLSNEKLQQVMAQIETTLMFWLPGRQPEAWRNIAARMATFVLKCTSKSQADTLKRTFHYYTARTTRIPLLHNTYNAHSIITQHVQHTFH
jgi:hypothetical protein